MKKWITRILVAVLIGWCHFYSSQYIHDLDPVAQPVSSPSPAARPACCHRRDHRDLFRLRQACGLKRPVTKPWSSPILEGGIYWQTKLWTAWTNAVVLLLYQSDE